ncbi:MAG: hypothetical protein JWQ89_4465 [Devosia sp.]|uniref:hypothetical protein n=1 Tax=Devosia sp. TaxID=1871048 RepID=UPI00261EE9A8|nr:hypothetical protein [Devosia sp.]MDB5542738.1 hypothetical protein [Devosia sp.]
MIRLAAIAPIAIGGLCGLATPSLATEWINCASPDGGASIDILVGTTDVIAVAGMTITVGEKVWATDPAYGPGDPVSVGQAFEDAEAIRIDAVDPNVTTKVAELRLFKATEDEAATIYGGTLRIPGHGAWAVSCTGP